MDRLTLAHVIAAFVEATRLVSGPRFLWSTNHHPVRETWHPAVRTINTGATVERQLHPSGIMEVPNKASPGQVDFGLLCSLRMGALYF